MLFVIRRQRFAVTEWRASVLWCEGCILGRNCKDCVWPSVEIILKTLQSNCSLNNDYNLVFEVKKKKKELYEINSKESMSLHKHNVFLPMKHPLQITALQVMSDV